MSAISTERNIPMVKVDKPITDRLILLRGSFRYNERMGGGAKW